MYRCCLQTDFSCCTSPATTVGKQAEHAQQASRAHKDAHVAHYKLQFKSINELGAHHIRRMPGICWFRSLFLCFWFEAMQTTLAAFFAGKGRQPASEKQSRAGSGGVDAPKAATERKNGFNLHALKALDCSTPTEFDKNVRYVGVLPPPAGAFPLEVLSLKK